MIENTKITIVEDEQKVSTLLCQFLQIHGFEVNVIRSGPAASKQIIALQPSLVILDLVLPEIDGLSICKEIRSHFKGRILFLTDCDDQMNQVACFELGADDYVTKPIPPRALLARIQMLLRRKPFATETSQTELEAQGGRSRTLSFGQLRINANKRMAFMNNQQIPLSTREFDLLYLLASHPEQILSRDYIYQNLKGTGYNGVDRAMDTAIANLRKKCSDSAQLSQKIITVRGQGYLFVPDGWEAISA